MLSIRCPPPTPWLTFYPPMKGSFHILSKSKYLQIYLAILRKERISTNTKRFSTLWATLQAANLSDVAASEGPFTLFAPTNDAFAKVSTFDNDDDDDGKDVGDEDDYNVGK